MLDVPTLSLSSNILPFRPLSSEDDHLCPRFALGLGLGLGAVFWRKYLTFFAYASRPDAPLRSLSGSPPPPPSPLAAPVEALLHSRGEPWRRSIPAAGLADGPHSTLTRCVLVVTDIELLMDIDYRRLRARHRVSDAGGRVGAC